MKNCPYCNVAPTDSYVQYYCPKCGIAAPHTNGGKNDAHADHIDNKQAKLNWNKMVLYIEIGMQVEKMDLGNLEKAVNA